MSTAPASPLASRRKPGQQRSIVTVNAIFEASIQVLLQVGMHQLTTTRVAARAGVSVGTLYQYYPNKQALLYAVLERHLDGVVQAVEVAAQKTHNQSLARMVEAVVRAFVKAKIARPEEARALYAVAGELGSAEIVKRTGARAGKALAAMLSTASDAKFNHPAIAAYIFATAMIGPTKGVIEEQAPPALLRMLHSQLVSLCLGYLEREALAFNAP